MMNPEKDSIKDIMNPEAREQRDRDAFQQIKANAQTAKEKARVRAYEAHLVKVQAMNRMYNAHWRPHAYADFRWETCVICRKEIRDDPYGHNAYPLAEEGHCCSKCNEVVVEARLVDLRQN